MGRMAGKGSSGPGEKETWSTEVVLIMLWMASRSYVPMRVRKGTEKGSESGLDLGTSAVVAVYGRVWDLAFWVGECSTHLCGGEYNV